MRNALSVLLALLSLTLVAIDADAKRMGGGRSIGKQRQAISPHQASPRTPAQQQQQGASNVPAQQKQATPTSPPAQQPSGWRRWLGPLAGLAIGASLASLFLHNGMGGMLAGLLLIAALVIGAMLLVRLLRGNRGTPEPLRYAGANPYGGSTSAPIEPTLRSTTSAAAAHSVAASTQWPAGFDEQEFVRHAKVNFVNLQTAHDRKDLTTMRDFLTPELYRDIEADVRASGDTPQKTEVVTLDARVIDVAAESGLYVVSVRFSGLIRESEGAEPQPFSEVWHLEKPTSGRSGWLVSGIQQD